MTTDSFILFIDPDLKPSSAASAARNGLLTLEPLPSLGNVTGNPHPYPPKPVPVDAGMGFGGYGCRFS